MVAGAAALRAKTGAALVGALLLVAGCVPPDLGTPEPPARKPVPVTPAPPTAGAVIHPVPEPEPPATSGSGAPPSLPARPAAPVSAAAQTLLTQSRTYQAAGQYEQAAASIERALRIEPRHPQLWLELGNIRLEEGDFPQAESMGRKALSLSAGDDVLTARAEQLIRSAKNR